ncbi:MAG: lysylphosphatidylglycerol synthase transmembrane domain-containing protein [Xenococcaceae cyanobacterium]
MLSFKNTIYTVLSLGIGVFLVWLILTVTPVSVEQIFDKLQHLNVIFVGCVILSTFTHLWLSAYKWRLITEKLTKNNERSPKFYLSYMIIANLVIQFLPQHIGMTFVQSFAVKLHKIGSLSKGVFSVIYDQLLNILIPVLLLPPSVLFILGKISLSLAIFIYLGILLLAHYVITQWHKPLIIFTVEKYWQLKQLLSKNKISGTVENKIADIPILSTRFTLRLFWLSVLRHINWTLRSFFVVLAGNFAIKFWSILFTINIVQSAMLVSITPANLGFMEWSWIGSLALLGVPAVETGNFAILQRIITLASIVLIALIFWVFTIFNNFSKVKTKFDSSKN